jgi:hypothetical protein
MVNQEFFKLCELNANFHMCSALTGHAKSIALFHKDGTPFTDQEKIDFAVESAQKHIDLYKEHMERKDFYSYYTKSS